ncbi:MAG: C40 family peptidase [Barnesiella sp.]|nr:C40 family peptidase [Barnesiella sp.]
MKKLIILLLSLTSILSAYAAAPADTLWAQVTIPVACIREKPSHSAQMTSQAILGTPLRITGQPDNEWLAIEGPDGYTGYMIYSSVTRPSHSDMRAWRSAKRLVVRPYREAIAYTSPHLRDPRSVLTELVPGSIVEGTLSNDSVTEIRLPDGRKGWVATARLQPIEQWASQPLSTDSVIMTAYSLMGAPYLWGGMSTKAVDCSGLVRVAYQGNGILLRRDASQQIHTGKKISPSTPIDSLRHGDLLFFSYVPGGRISHVALYDSDSTYIHSSGRVKVNRMKADDPDFSHRVYRGASRIEGAIPSAGITTFRLHPWYF